MKYLLLVLFSVISEHYVYSQKQNSLSYLDQLSFSQEKLTNVSKSNFSYQLHYELIEKILPYWYGTPWDYNGYTNTPNKGSIACGYFVSTTLKHLGFNLNRYDIAKMYSSDIINVLCHKDCKTHYNFKSFQTYCKSLPNGLYILGLSNHVGFLSIEDGNSFFIHSDYSSVEGVRKEPIQSSFALENSNSFWVGNFSNHLKTINWYRNRLVYAKIEKINN